MVATGGAYEDHGQCRSSGVQSTHGSRYGRTDGTLVVEELGAVQRSLERVDPEGPSMRLRTAAARPAAAAGAAEGHAPLPLLLLAFATIYLVWGSTYLAIAVAVETLPPFLMVAVRMLVAGGLLYGYARIRGESAYERSEWRFAFTNGSLLFLGGYGLVAWAEQQVASGVTAMLATTAPFWLVLIQWATGAGRPRLRTWAGLALGTAGVALLFSQGSVGGDAATVRTVAVLVSSICWAAGTLRASRRQTRGSAARAAGAEMLAGGWLLLTIGLLLGEAEGASLAGLTTKAVLALAYLIVFGSIGAFTAYRWLLQRVSPSLVATHAYVNPLVALILGWAILAEPLGVRVIASSVAIIGAIALMRARQRTVATAQSQEPRPSRPTPRTRMRSPGRTSLNLASVVTTRMKPRACPADGPHSTS